MLGCLDTPALKTGTATQKFDLRLGWDAHSHQYGVALIVNNVFDRRYVYSLGGPPQAYGMPYASLQPPRAIGLQLNVRM